MSKPKRQCKERTCFVPLCTSGYRSNKQQVSLFTAPADATRLAEWERAIKREDRRLTLASVVCEKHFEESCIERAFKVTVNGVVNEIARDKPRLKPDAVPTLFEQYPKHLVPKKAPKRKVRNLCLQEPPPQRRREKSHPLDGGVIGNIATDEIESSVCSDDSAACAKRTERLDSQGEPASQSQSDNQPVLQSSTESGHPFSGISIPATWMEVPSVSNDCLSYASCEAEENNFGNLFIERMVIFGKALPERGSILATVYLRGREHSKQVLATRSEAELLVKKISMMILCCGCGMKPVSNKYSMYRKMFFAARCLLTTETEGGSCAQCKYQRVLAQNKMGRLRKQKGSTCEKRKHHNTSRTLTRTKKKLARVQAQVAQMKEENKTISEEALEARIRALPQKQKLAVKNCFTAAQRKSLRGMTYDDEWIVECIMMRMRSPKLYEHLRKEKVMILPGRTCLKKYLQRFEGGFGLNPKVYAALAEKTKDMDDFSCHGGLVIDELKLSEHLDVKSNGGIEGFVDLGEQSPSDQKGILADHGMVVLFQPFTGNWTQILGVFAARGNVKAPTLAKIIIETTILAEQAGLVVDTVTCDGASWNRSMWRHFGVQVSADGRIKNSTRHPVDPTRQLFFISDFPHLIKNVRNGFVAKGYLTPSGHVHSGVVQAAWDVDRDNVTLKAMPSITLAHIKPNCFEKMKVNLAFQLFGDEVIKGLFEHRKHILSRYRTMEPTEDFIRQMNKLIRIMTARMSARALKPGSPNATFLQKFLVYLNEWEAHAKPAGGGFLTGSTASGLRVTIKSTLDLLSYLNSVAGFTYLLTARLSQDKLENLFGIIRQSAGCNDHPTVSQFLVTVNVLSFYNLARSPKGGNCPPAVVKSLLSTADVPTVTAKCLSDQLDHFLDNGNIDEAEDVLQSIHPENDHEGYSNKKSNAALVYYVAGYVSRKTVAKNACTSCAAELCVSQKEAMNDVNSYFTAHFDNGGLIYPTDNLAKTVAAMEDAFTSFFSKNSVHEKSMQEFARSLQSSKLPQIGCPEHGKKTLATVVKFYILLRFRFFLKGLNRDREGQRQRLKYLKLRHCQ
ncbi:uncharacterized protein ISCGN_006283 [Ixodes scapularis]